MPKHKVEGTECQRLLYCLACRKQLKMDTFIASQLRVAFGFRIGLGFDQILDPYFLNHMELNFSTAKTVLRHETLSFSFFFGGGGGRWVVCMVLKVEGRGLVATNSMESKVFLSSHAPPPSSLPLFGSFGFPTGSVIHIALLEFRKRVLRM